MSQIDTNGRPDGYEVPVHRSLVNPVLLVGLPRNAALFYWTIGIALIVGMRQLWVLPFVILGYIGGLRLTKWDNYFWDVIRSSIRHNKEKLP